MKKIIYTLLVLTCGYTQAQELRGTWMARNSFADKATIARSMDSLAQNNFNIVFVDAWSRGYPLWQSQKFFNETGMYTDPVYAGRDILAETIAEAHRVGLHVGAWFEYGFVGGWSGNMPVGQKGPIFNAHPEWVAQQQNGTEIDGSKFYWMIHTKPECQNFLIGLCTELLRNYDIDNFEWDRIRYSSLSYGYDPYTVALYQSEHGGASPPVNTSDAAWMAWRATKLNNFVARAWDSTNVVNPNVNISSAPGHYSSTAYQAYNSYLQDWKWWINNAKVDNLEIQVYTYPLSNYDSYITYIKNSTVNYPKIFPSFAINTGSNTLTNSEISQYIDKNKLRKFKGQAIWFYNDLEGRMAYIKANRYTTYKYPPWSTLNYRSRKAITLISNVADAVRTGTWSSSSLNGYSGSSIYADNIGTKAVDYYATVPATAWYEVYAWQVTYSNRSVNAEWKAYNNSGASVTRVIDQTNTLNNGWVKIGDVLLSSGRQHVASVSNNGLVSPQLVSADAVMIVLNRRLSPSVALRVQLAMREMETKKEFTVYPSTNNGSFTVELPAESTGQYEITVTDMIGKTVYSEIWNENNFDRKKNIDLKNPNNGLMFVNIIHNGTRNTSRINIQK